VPICISDDKEYAKSVRKKNMKDRFLLVLKANREYEYRDIFRRIRLVKKEKEV
jgi:hypothetical protein